MASYEKMKNGTWSVRFRVLTLDGVKNNRLSGFPRKADAEKAYREYMSSYIPPSINTDDSKELTVGELYLSYCNYLKVNAKASSLYTIQRILTDHVLPYFENTPVKDLNKKALWDWQVRLWGKDYSYGYKKRIRSYFHGLLLYGNREFDTPPSEFTKVPTPKNKGVEAEMSVWSETEFETFLAGLNKLPVQNIHIYAAYFQTLFMTGMRKGEALALTWRDFDVDNDQIRINKTHTNKVFANGGKSYEITAPKTRSSIRTIRIPHELTKTLLQLRGNRKNMQAFIFGESDPLCRTNIDRYFNEAIRRSGVKKIRIHDLRHSHASILLSHGASAVAVAKRLGHANTQQTLNTYAHMIPGDEEKILDILDNCT